jgi:hypothetical protein
VTRERGQATVELALVLPSLAVILALVFEVALMGTDQVRLWHAAREAARVAVVDADPTAALAAARRSGLPGVRVELDPEPGHRVAGRPVTVQVSYAPAERVPWLGGALGSLRLQAEASMRIEQP